MFRDASDKTIFNNRAQQIIMVDIKWVKSNVPRGSTDVTDNDENSSIIFNWDRDEIKLVIPKEIQEEIETNLILKKNIQKMYNCDCTEHLERFRNSYSFQTHLKSFCKVSLKKN